MRTLVDVATARKIILGTAGTTGVERVPLAESIGRTLAQPAVADMDVPPFRNSAMDGYAVRAEDLVGPGTELLLAGAVRAGEWPEGAVLPGTCWSITTGSPIPRGADSVVPVEETAPAANGHVRFERATETGRHVRQAGKDVARGEVVVGPGTAITASVAGVLAMVGVSIVPVGVSPTVSIVATGDELVPPGETPGPGKIRNSNAFALAAQAAGVGAVVQHVLHARDDAAATRQALVRAVESDVVVVSGGVSMGAHDIVRGVLSDMGAEWLFWKVLQRPGKPLAFGRLGPRHVFGLPGNPVSSSVCFDQYVRPLLLHMQGRAPIWRPRFRATLVEELPKPAGLHVYSRGVASSGEGPRLVVRPTGPQGSNLFTSVLRANCLVHLPAEMDRAPAGTVVEVEWLRW